MFLTNYVSLEQQWHKPNSIGDYQSHFLAFCIG